MVVKLVLLKFLQVVLIQELSEIGYNNLKSKKSLSTQRRLFIILCTHSFKLIQFKVSGTLFAGGSQLRR